ncbi:zinc finger protein ush-like isoform X3 [Stegodyphus dumicola]|uniref:zinc finger protein ush-like isoform X3 n=1 Tax=Stegodyphus dumicola TaxID=202533 RepID=UPI0015AEB519|nr:zinc finger protein ush-like isoform X3 [Stegodyphus dumicola]
MSRESTDFDQIAPDLKFPIAQLYLKKFGGESLILTKEPLKAGTVLGTYKGGVQESDTEDDKTFKVNRSDGGSPVHVMLENEGHWLKLMRTAALPTDANISLRISGSDIICTVTKDVNKEVELKVTCRISEAGDEKEDNSPKVSDAEGSPVILSQRSQEKELFSAEEKPELVPSSNERSETEAMLDYASEGSKNSDTGRTYKNSRIRKLSSEKRLKSRSYDSDSDCDMDDARRGEVSSSTSAMQEAPSSDDKEFDGIKVKCGKDATSKDSNKSIILEDQRKIQLKDESGHLPYGCPVCDFTAMDQYSYDKHVRSHHNLNTSHASNLTNPKSFCDACKIQFMSINTYQVHKKYYCRSRHDTEDLRRTSPVADINVASTAFRTASDTVILRNGINGAVTPSIIQPQAIYAAISTNPLILLPCSLVPGQGLVPQNGVIPTGGPSIVLQTNATCSTVVDKSISSQSVESSGPYRKSSHPVINTGIESSAKAGYNSKTPQMKRKMSEGDVLNLKKTCTSDELRASSPDRITQKTENENVDQEAPLDLSLKRKRISSLLSSPSLMKRRNSSASTGRPSPPVHSRSPPSGCIVSSPRGAISPSSPYNSESSSCYSSHVPVVVQRVSQAVSERISPLPPVLQAAVVGDKPVTTPGMPPPKLMKQGNNVCEECHIIFYKYDNYLAHKTHYCTNRRRQLSALAAVAAAASSALEHSSDENSNHNPLNDSTQSCHSDDPSKPGLRRMEYGVDHFRTPVAKQSQPVYSCDACGVKFSTSDNLNAHQTYYCIKKSESARNVSGKKGDGGNSPKLLEPPFCGPDEWKCNYCDASCSSYETMRRHLLTHTELKGFCCAVCGYKGNTLRGMRNHACEHLKDDSTSLDEFVASSVIAQSAAIPVLPRAVIHCSDEESETNKEIKCLVKKEQKSSLELFNEVTSPEQDSVPTDHSEPEDSPRSDGRISDTRHKQSCSVKTESGDSSSDGNVSNHHESVNPLAFCDVVIKTENDRDGSADDSSRDELPRSYIKFEPETECDSGDKPRDMSISPSSQSTSVIRVTSEAQRSENGKHFSHTSRKKRNTQVKSHSELKYCKSCDISFLHIDNFVAHKKYYCVSRVIQNCLQETATVK